MKINVSKEEFDKLRYNDLVPLTCCSCDIIYFRAKKRILDNIKRKKREENFCSNKCQGIYQNKQAAYHCANCDATIYRRPIEASKYRNQFCNSSCAATYNNTHKTKGTRRSRLEEWLEIKLSETYDFEILYCDKSTINSELDIYIPHLKLAFELNGIFHYEPIFGEEKLKQIQNNDKRKLQVCLENKIEMVEIDASGLSYNTEQNMTKYLNVICSIINRKIFSAAGGERSHMYPISLSTI